VPVANVGYWDDLRPSRSIFDP